ncbi:MAG: hypothetical protein J0H66_11730 [Solirubrobacterales bacterium]|nr:hypothetical protein [Solirubrobacterales bacterium]
MIEAGKTYERAPFSQAPGIAPTRVIAVRELGSRVWMVRKANGLETVAGAESLTGPVEPLRPGIEEPCLICGGTKSVPIDAPEHPDEPWSRKIVGHEPCPNCSVGRTQMQESID